MAGHSIREVKKYTLRQARTFYDLVTENQMEALKRAAVAGRLAQIAEPRDFMKALNRFGEESG